MNLSNDEYITTLCTNVYTRTDRERQPFVTRTMRDHGLPIAPDMILDDGRKLHAFVITRAGDADRVSLVYNPESPIDDQLHRLLSFGQQYPRTVVPHVGVRFNNRQLILTTLWKDGPNDDMALKSAAESAPTDVRVTDAQNLSFHKPATDSWPSATTGDDTQYLLDHVNY